MEDQWFLNGKKVIKQQMLSKSSHQIINGVSITLEASFGCLQNPIRKNCMFVNDDTLMFISGKHIVLYDIIRKRQTYIMKSAEDEVVQALSFHVSHGQKLFIAIAFKSTSKILPTVKVYNRKKKRFYQCVHSHLLPNSNIHEILFINDGKHLISLSTQEDGYGMSLFAVSKEVSLSYTLIKQKINMLESISDFEFFLIGPQFLTSYKYQADISGLEIQNNLITVLELQFDENIVGVCYNSEKKYAIVATSKNNLIMIKGDKNVAKFELQTQQKESNHLLQQINKDKNKPTEQEKLVNVRISTIAKTNKGFIIGLIGKPALQVYEIEQDASEQEQYILNLVGSYFIKDEHIYGIHQIHLATDEMYAALTVIYFNRSAYQVALGSQQVLNNIVSCEQILENYQGKLELFTFNLAIVEALKSVQKDPFEPLFEKGVHKGTIFNIATTPMRSIIASVCDDKNIKFWDYSNDFKEMFSHQFHETPLSVAIHPLSYQCAIGFKDGLRFYFILDDDLKLVHNETTKVCNALTYSEGGHILAAANGNQIQLYNPLTYKMINVLPNHQTNLKDLLFIDRDNLLISQCQFGILYVWNLLSGERILEHAQKQNKYQSLCYDFEYDLVIGVSDQKLKVYHEKGQNMVLEVDTSPTQFSAICISHRYNAIFFGTTQGSIRVYSYPFYHFNPKMMESIEIPVHQLAVTAIKVSPDNSYLISSSIDGSIFFSKIKQFINGEEITQLDLITRGDIENKITNTFALNSLCLCSTTAQEIRQEQLKELEYRLQNFKSDIDDAKEVQLNNNDYKLKKIRDEHTKEIQKVQDLLSQTIQQSDAKNNKIKEDKKNLISTSKKTIEEMNEQNSKKLLQIYDIRDKLNEKLQNIIKQQDEERRLVNQEYQQSISQVDDEYCQKYQDLFNRFSQAMSNMKLDQRKFKEVLQQSEKDYETFYKESQQSLKAKLEEFNTQTEILRSSISRFKKEIVRYQNRKEILHNLKKETEESLQSLRQELKGYEEKHKMMLADLREKEKLINQREQQIKDFRMKNVHLQNFQKVYDYRVNTLKDEREPLMDHLKNMEKHVKNLYNELIEESGLKQSRIEEERKLITDLNIFKNQLKSALTVLSLSKRNMENFKSSIQTLINSDTGDWPEKLEELYHMVQKENSKAITIKNPVFQETLKDMQKDPLQQQIDQSQQNAIYKALSSQKQYLQQSLSEVEASVKYQLGQREVAYDTIQDQNKHLIKQCKELREKKQELKSQLDSMNKEYREKKRELNSQGIEIPEENEDDNQFARTYATTFTSITRTPGTKSQQNFRTKIIRNIG
ncbi:unnamed protein product [Paramecium pentaurelia]|uniref:Uncharacterized protein n=1 Tax=Paramecium pentaurelia TaxID=43138 RepID=A0A8S1W5U3_9CILI|nr:unnamed protein product [Paramecium pentaurelia]